MQLVLLPVPRLRCPRLFHGISISLVYLLCQPAGLPTPVTHFEKIVCVQKGQCQRTSIGISSLKTFMRLAIAVLCTKEGLVYSAIWTLYVLAAELANLTES